MAEKQQQTRRVWRMIGIAIKDKPQLELFLQANYEPFAVITDKYQGEIVWLKTQEEVPIEIPSDTQEQGTDDSGASGADTTAAEEEDSS